MAFVNLSGISIAFGDRDILDNVNINISSLSRIALAGANGSGKSTLLKIIAGKASPDSGEVSSGKAVRVSYLPQSGIVLKGNTLIAEAEKAFFRFEVMLNRMREIEKNLSDATGETKEETLLEELHFLQESLVFGGYYEREKEIDTILTGLGFSPDSFTKKTEEFSGGWQMRIALATILLEKPNIMLLDEPTNYLDIEARRWLENFLNRFTGGVVIVSHDRFFLDIICNEVIELFSGKLNRYKGNYSNYEKTRKAELASLVDRYGRQQEEIEKTEYFISKFRSNASKASLVQSRIKQLDNMVKLEIPESLKKIHFHFPPAPHSGRDVLFVEHLEKYYNDFHALKDINFTLVRGEKIALVGKNGAGKSTLLRILSEEDKNFSGTIRFGKGIKAGYFSQDFGTTLSDSNTVIEEVESVAPTKLIPAIRGLLGAFLFRGDDIYKKVSYLSGGEKNRVALLKLLLHPANFLVLDEPTNHLDLNSKDILLEALTKYEGTLIFVSHDQYFIEKLATRVIEINGGVLQNFPGDYQYYRWKKDGESNSNENTALQSSFIAPYRNSSGRENIRENEKIAKRERRKLERELKEAMVAIEKTEKEITEIECQMALLENYSDGEKIKQLKIALDEGNEKLLRLAETWETIESLL